MSMSTDPECAQLGGTAERLTGHRLQPAILGAKQDDDIPNDLEQGSGQERRRNNRSRDPNIAMSSSITKDGTGATHCIKNGSNQYG